jgi:dUTP pyrophosphatase
MSTSNSIDVICNEIENSVIYGVPVTQKAYNTPKIISWSNSRNGGSSSWSGGFSNERIAKTGGWSSSWANIGKSLANIQAPPYKVVSIKKSKPRSYFKLSLFIDSTENYELYKKYVSAVEKHNAVVKQYKTSFYGAYSGAGTGADSDDGAVYFDAGFDLFYPDTIDVHDSRSGPNVYKLNHMVKCSMSKIDYDIDGKEMRSPVGYYMYPRSSTGTKTPLRLANSVGIIDSGYRGHIIAAFDSPASFTCEGGCYTVEPFQRLVQICPPDLSYPVEVELVADDTLLGGGSRGSGGFGSTGV